MSLLPVGAGTFPTIQRPSHMPPALHHGQHPKFAGPGRRQFALPSHFHCGRAGCSMGAATATPAVNTEPARPLIGLRSIPVPFLGLFSRAPSSLY